MELGLSLCIYIWVARGWGLIKLCLRDWAEGVLNKKLIWGWEGRI